jgi:hypothetical protein
MVNLLRRKLAGVGGCSFLFSVDFILFISVGRWRRNDDARANKNAAKIFEFNTASVCWSNWIKTE